MLAALHKTYILFRHYIIKFASSLLKLMSYRLERANSLDFGIMEIDSAIHVWKWHFVYHTHHGSLWIKKSICGCTMNMKTKLVNMCELLSLWAQKIHSIKYKKRTLYTRIKIHTLFPFFFSKHLNNMALPLMGWKLASPMSLDYRDGTWTRWTKVRVQAAKADGTVTAWVIWRSETMALSIINFLINLTACQPHGLKEGQRDGRDSATSADNSMGGAGAEKYSKPGSFSLKQIHSWCFSNMTELCIKDTPCLPYSIRKWHLLLFLIVSNDAEGEQNSRRAAKQRNQGLKPLTHMT